MPGARTTAAQLAATKPEGRRLTCLTCYDYSMAQLVDYHGADLILVGDSLGNVILGYDTTLPVTMDDMIHHARAVVRGTQRAHVCLDMPFLSYQLSAREALANAGRAVQEAGVQSVKIEGGRCRIDTVALLIENGVAVLGHLGYTPQSTHVLPGKRYRDTAQAREVLLADAKALEEAGCYAIVLEMVPRGMAGEVTHELSIPTIGIGSGPGCDGQVLNLYDMLGLGKGKGFRHNKRYTELDEIIGEAVERYLREVQAGDFPGEEHSFG